MIGIAQNHLGQDMACPLAVPVPQENNRGFEEAKQLSSRRALLPLFSFRTAKRVRVEEKETPKRL
jgi:hypothetical protein